MFYTPSHGITHNTAISRNLHTYLNIRSIFLIAKPSSMLKPIPFLCLVLTLCACRAEKKPVYRTNLEQKSGNFTRYSIGKKPIIRLNLGDLSPIPSTKTSTLFELVKLIPLEDQHPLGQVEKIILLDQQIVVFDRSINNMAALFDYSGKFICKLGTIGEGPREYLRLADIQYNLYHQTLDIWDDLSRKVIQFSLDGAFVQEKNVDVFASHFAPVDSNTYLFYKGASLVDPDLDTRFITVNIKTNTILSKDFPIEPHQEAIRFEPNAILRYNRYGQGYFFNDNHYNTIYSFTPKQIQQRIFVDFGDKALPADELRFKKLDAQRYFKLLTKPGTYSTIRRPIETKDAILFQFAHGEKLLTCIHDKRTHQSRIFERFFDDLFGNALLFPPIDADEAGHFVFALDPLMIREVLLQKSEKTGIPVDQLLEQLQQSNPTAYNLAKETTATSNLMLVFVRLKS